MKTLCIAVLAVACSLAQASLPFTNTGSLTTGRWHHTATLLSNGKVLLAGGTNGSTLASAELYDPATGTSTATGSLVSARESHTSILLPSGKVLVVGGFNGFNGSMDPSAELYDPATGQWTQTGSIAVARENPTATLLPNGKVLIAGGYNGVARANAELYDPATGTWTATGSLSSARFYHTATLLPNGKVLVAGGFNSSALASAELYDPSTGTWTTTGDLATTRDAHTATLLPNGKLLVAGGDNGNALASTELYDPANGTWTATGDLGTTRSFQTATLLPNGTVLVTGGNDGSTSLASAELYDPTNGTWTATTGSLATARDGPTATLLPNGRVLITGGLGASLNYLTSAELYDSANGAWTITGSLVSARKYHTATLLPDGKVIVIGGQATGGTNVGSSDLYDPASGTWTSSPSSSRSSHTATLMPNGKVLVAGGYDIGGNLASAVLYNSASGTWSATGSLASARESHTAILLPNGKVLVAGGFNGSALASAELYDPASGTWTVTGSLATARIYHTATLLPNGKVLVTGGYNTSSYHLASAELYDPASGTWSATGDLITSRDFHTATLLPNGKVLVAGGSGGGALTNAELYDPASGTWTATGSLASARYSHTATLLPNGKVLVVAGGDYRSSSLASAQLYDPATGLWSVTGSLSTAHISPTATLLPNGKLLLAAGLGNSNSSLASAELYDVGLGFSSDWQPQISSASFNDSGQLLLTGTRFTGISEASGGGTNNSASNSPVVQVLSLVNEQSRFLASDPASNWSATSFTSVPVTGLPAGYALVTVFTNGIPSTSAIVNQTPPAITNVWSNSGPPTGGAAVTITGTNFTGATSVTIGGTAATSVYVLSATTIICVTPAGTLGPASVVVTTPSGSNAANTLYCFGQLPINYAQTITFAPPSTLYPSQSPFTLSASSSSGIPVRLRLVSPVPAGVSLTGNVLSFTTACTIKVQADCSASGNYNDAAPVVKTISVKPYPNVLTLINLAQVYDGNPKPIAALSGTGVPVITYKVGASYTTMPPTNAGSYPFKAVALPTTTVSGTLVIAKAPLYVTPDHQFKLAGRVNPALTFTYSGFVNGETASVLTHAPVLSTSVTLSSPGGIYPITASGGAAANYSFVYKTAILFVKSFTGSYEALLVDGNSIPTGKLSLTVAANASNSFTGKLYAGPETTALPITGTLATNVLTEQASSTVYLVNGSGIPYVISFTLPFSLAQTVTASVTRDNAPLGSSSTGQRLSTATVNYAGAHTAVLEPSTQPGNTTPAGPGGAGWATATISSTGVLTLTGKLGDDTAFTAALSPDIQSDPGYRLFAQPYLAARTQSFIAGAFALAPHPTLTNRRYLAQSALTWRKTGLPADASYRAGFDPLNTVLMIDPWQAPKTTVPTVTLAQRLGLTGPSISFHVTHSATSSASQVDLPTKLGLSTANAVSVLDPLANLTKWKTLTFVPSTGTFTGSFILTDGPTKRTATFSGVLRQSAAAMDTLIGDGSYVLPPLNGTERGCGEIIFSRP